MNRDLSRFPSDSHGDVLWELAQQGVDLSREREVDFFVYFPLESKAMEFSVELLQQGVKVSYSPYEGPESHPCQVTAHVPMVPRHEEILEVVDLLSEGATPKGGVAEGWGFYQD